MIELFEFEVKGIEGSSFSDEGVDRFITQFLESRGLYWGGGYGPDYVTGVVATEQSFDLNVLIDEFINFFRDANSIILRIITDPQNLTDMNRLENRKNVTFEPYTDDDESE